MFNCYWRKTSESDEQGEQQQERKKCIVKLKRKDAMENDMIALAQS